jgi:glycine betaine/proline transport system substrate-binding protein
MNTEYDIVYLEDPKNAQGDFDDPSKITAAVNKDLPNDDPAAYAFLKAIRLTEKQINEMEAEMKETGQGKEEQGVRNWLKKNEDVPKPWVDAAKNA